MQELSNKWIVGSGAGWLVTVDTADPKVTLLNPLTGKKISLPHLNTLLWCDLRADDDDPTAYWYFRKVTVGYYRGSFLIVALVSEWKTIRFRRIGDSKWSRLENSPLFIQDIIMHNSKLYAINDVGALFEINIADPEKMTMLAIPRLRPFGGKCFLVDLCGQLVLLELVEDECGYFEEYQTETGMQYPEKAGHSWVPLENLGHHIVFIEYNYSLSLDSRVYPRCKGNCIYFADCRSDDDDFGKMRGMSKKLHHDVGFYHMEDQKVKCFQNFSKASSAMNMVWLSPNFSSEIEMQMVHTVDNSLDGLGLCTCNFVVVIKFSCNVRRCILYPRH